MPGRGGEVIADGGNHQHAVVERPADCRANGFILACATEAKIDDMAAVLHRPVDGVHDVVIGCPAPSVAKDPVTPQCHPRGDAEALPTPRPFYE